MYWLTIDPGETTGWSVWQGTERVGGGQDPLWDFIDAVDAWFENGFICSGPVFGDANERIGALVVEDWRLYPWVIGSGALDFDACRTARGIGALELLARRNHIPIILQPASIKDAAKAAGAEEMYVSPVHENRHQNDSIQHGVFYLALNGNKPPC
jgi:hypothetical protein